jgi:O-antigen/teichoic acid export membrane protein
VWLPAPVFGIVFGAEIGGLVALVQRFVSVPLTIANQSLATLFHREFAARSASQAVRIVNALIMMALVVGLISLPLSAGALWYGSGIASRLFGGDEWSGVAIVAAAFVPVCAAQFICLFTDRILLVMGRSDLKLVFLVSALLMMPVTLALAKSIGLSWEAAIWTYAASQTIIYLLMFFSVIRVLRNQRDPVAHNEG